MIFLTQAKYISDYKIHCTFSDGKDGVVNCKKLLRGPIFDKIKQIEKFKNFRLDPITETIVWPNNADFAPILLYNNIE